jgi:hypothetical protein
MKTADELLQEMQADLKQKDYEDRRPTQYAWIRRRIQEWEDYKRSLCCSDCKRSFRNNPEWCDFHHTNPNTKISSLSQIAGSYRLSHKKVQVELAKCVPLCALCHRTLHMKLKKEQGYEDGNA